MLRVGRNGFGQFLLVLGVVSTALAESPVLLRDPSVSAIRTIQGEFPVHPTQVQPARDVTLLILTDTLTADDAVRVRHEISSALPTSFLTSHAVQLVNLTGASGDFSTRLSTNIQLQAALKQIAASGKNPVDPSTLIDTLAAIPASLPSNWAQTIIIGRLPSFTKDEIWPAAFLSEAYRKQKVRLDFWSLDATAPPWAQNIAAGSMGLVATGPFNALLPVLNDNTPYVEIAWQTQLAQGAWPYTADLKSASGESIASVVSLAQAPAYVLSAKTYLAARAEIDSAPDKLLALNPSDLDALRILGHQANQQKLFKEAAAQWHTITQITPGDGEAWAEFGQASYSAESFDDAASALKHAADLGVKTPGTLELQARLLIRTNDFAAALNPIEQALQTAQDRQSLWLERAECARALKLHPKETESIERAMALGDVPEPSTRELIALYIENSQADKAISVLRNAHPPTDAPTLAQYAHFWESVHQPQEAEALWQKTLAADPKREDPYAGLAAIYLSTNRYPDANRIADEGLRLFPASSPLLLAKEQALELSGDRGAARRLLAHSKTADIELLKRRALLEDHYGGLGADAYLALLAAQLTASAPQRDVVETCRRGLIVSLRGERPDAAKTFAEKLQSAGDRAGLELITLRLPGAAQRTEIPGGAEALEFVLGREPHGKTDVDQILLTAATIIAGFEPRSNNPEIKIQWQHQAESIHEYFQRVAALDALGERKGSAYVIELSLNDKAAKQRSEKVFDILGLKLHRDKEGLSLKAAEGKSQVKKQDVLSALAVDEQAIEEALAKGKSYSLEIPFDTVSVFPSDEYWRSNFTTKDQKLPGGLVEMFVEDPRLPHLYAALSRMDRSAAVALTTALKPKDLLDRYSTPLWFYSTAFALKANAAEIPGGDAARDVWRNLSGADPANGIAFFQSLMQKDDGRLVSFYYSLSQLDVEHQRFFTRSPERTKRFYELFRSSSEMRRGGDTRALEGGFSQFLREVPLNDDLSVDFPGGPEVWMVAKGFKSSATSVAKMTKKMKRTAAPDDEDAILTRLADTEYKNVGHEETELANFVAVARIDAQRTQPLPPESALLLAQSYSTHRGLFHYLVRLGDLETADYQKLLALESNIENVDSTSANLRLGQLHSFLSLAGAASENGLLTEAQFLPIFRKSLDGFAAAHDAAGWNAASLDFVSALIPFAKPAGKPGAEAAVRCFLLGASSPQREKAFDQVLALQKIPSLDALLSIDRRLRSSELSSPALDEMQRQIEALPVLDIPKEWHVPDYRKKSLECYETTSAIRLLGKLRLTAAKHKRNETEELQKLSTELRSSLEPWVSLALVGRIYARYLDSSDMLVSEDPMLARKHQFIQLGPHASKLDWFPSANLLVSSEGEGSYFFGGFAEFSLAAGEARAAGNHLNSEFFAAATVASVRATEWHGFDSNVLSSFGATVRFAREWIVESASNPAMLDQLGQASRGIISLGRRQSLLDHIARHDWPAVWRPLSVSDLHFIGDALIEQAPESMFQSAALSAMKVAAKHSVEPDMLGSVAPDLSGCAQPRLQRYEPYEEYERHLSPQALAQRLAELKLSVAWLADSLAWDPSAVVALAEPAANDLLLKLKMRNAFDWAGTLDSYRNLRPEILETLLTQP